MEIVFEFPDTPQFDFLTDGRGQSLYQEWLALGNTGDHADFLDWLKAVSGFIKSNESLSLAQRNGDILYGILDQYTGEQITLSKVTGTPTVDGIIYFQLGSEYFKRNYNQINVKWFGAKGDNINDDTVAIQNAVNACYTNLDTCYLPNGTYKITNTILITESINFRGENIEKTLISIVSVTRKVAIKVHILGYTGVGGGLQNFKVSGNTTCDGILIECASGFSLHQAVYKDLKIKQVVLGFETKCAPLQNFIYVCVFDNIAIEEGIYEGGMKLHGGSYNTFNQLSASYGLEGSNYYGFNIAQTGSTITNITTDSYVICDNIYGVMTNFVSEASPNINALPQRECVLEIFEGTYNSLFFVNISKNRYESVIKFNERKVTVTNIEVNNNSETMPDYSFNMATSGGSGLIENFRTLTPFANKLENYISAANLQYYKFANCEDITDLSYRIAKRVSALPIANEKLRHTEIILIEGTGKADTTYVCVKNKANTYEWVEKYNSKNAKKLTNNTFQNIDANAINEEGKFSAFPILAEGTNLFPTVNNANAILHVDMYEGTGEFSQIGFNGAGEVYHRYSTGAWKKILKEDTDIKVTKISLSALNTAPASATATGALGEIRYDANYMYVCVATNTWKRSAITTW